MAPAMPFQPLPYATKMQGDFVAWPAAHCLSPLPCGRRYAHQYNFYATPGMMGAGSLPPMSPTFGTAFMPEPTFGFQPQ